MGATHALIEMNTGQSRFAATAEANGWKITSTSERDRQSFHDDHIVNEVIIAAERESVETDETLRMHVTAKWVNGRLAEATMFGLYLDRYAPGYEPDPNDADSGLTYRQMLNEGYDFGLAEDDVAFCFATNRVREVLDFLTSGSHGSSVKAIDVFAGDHPGARSRSGMIHEGER